MPHPSTHSIFRFVLCLIFIGATGLALGGLHKGGLAPQAHAASPPCTVPGDTVYWTHLDDGQTMTFDGTHVTVRDTRKQYDLKLVLYKANQLPWGPTWRAIGPPRVYDDIVDGSRVEVPFQGYFQADLIPQSATVYQSPSWYGDKYGYPGDDVLKAAVNSERTCPPSVEPTPTPDPNQKPTNVGVIEDDADEGSVIQTYNIKIQWTPPTSPSFASGTSRYRVYLSDSSGFTTNVINTTRAKTVPWYSTRGDTSAIDVVRQNKRYYVRVCAEYAGSGGWSQQCADDVSFTKVPYAQATFSGATNQRIVTDSSPAACSTGAPERFVGTLTLSPNTNGYSTTCTTTTTASRTTDFSCAITLDNVNYDPNPHQSYSLTMTGGASAYGCGGDCATPGACSNVFAPNLDANETRVTTGSSALYVNTELAASFFKVKNMSVYTSGGINSPFPAGHKPYNANDIGDNFFNQGVTGSSDGVGVVVSNGTQTAGLSSAPNNGISARGWQAGDYQTSATKYVGSSFITFAKGQKQVQSINSLSDSAFTSASSGIFLIRSDLTLNNSNISALNNKYVILMSEGTIRISDDFTPTNSNIALFARTIYIENAVTSVQAILSANTIYVTSPANTTSTTPLSIIGSLSAQQPIDMSKRARRDDDLKPSVFVQADPGAYLTLLPYMSTTKTEYKQIQ